MNLMKTLIEQQTGFFSRFSVQAVILNVRVGFELKL